MLFLIKNHMKEILSKKMNITIIVSVLILLTIGTFYSIKNDNVIQDEAEYTLGIIDEDNNTISKMLVSYFRDNKTFTSYLNVIEGNEKEIKRKFEQGEIFVYIEIPDQFIKNMIYLENQPIKVYINANNTTEIIIVQNILESYEKYIMAVEKNVMTLYSKMEKDKFSQDTIQKANYEISLDLVMTALSRGDFFDFKEIKDSKSIGIINYYCYAGIALLIIYVTIFSGIKLLMERNLGILSRYLVSGNSMRLYLFSKVIVQMVFVSFVTIVNIFLIHGYITNSVIDSMQIYLLIISFYLLFIGLFFFISSLVKTRQNYLLISNALTLVMLIIGGGIIPIKYMPDNLVSLSKLTPVYWFVKGIIAIQNNTDTGIVIGIISVFMLLGIGLFLFTAYFGQKAGEKYE